MAINNTNILVKDSLRHSIESTSDGRNTIIYDDKGNPNHMVVLPKFTIREALSKANRLNALEHVAMEDNAPHPAFVKRIDEETTEEVPYIFVGKYLASKVGYGSNQRLVSMPNSAPAWSSKDFSLSNVKNFLDPTGNFHLFNILEDAAFKYDRINKDRYILKYREKSRRKGVATAVVGISIWPTNTRTSHVPGTKFRRTDNTGRTFTAQRTHSFPFRNGFINLVLLECDQPEAYDINYRQAVNHPPISDGSFEATWGTGDQIFTLYPASEYVGIDPMSSDDETAFGLFDRNVLQYIDGVRIDNQADGSPSSSYSRRIHVLDTNYSSGDATNYMKATDFSFRIVGTSINYVRFRVHGSVSESVAMPDPDPGTRDWFTVNGRTFRRWTRMESQLHDGGLNPPAWNNPTQVHSSDNGFLAANKIDLINSLIYCPFRFEQFDKLFGKNLTTRNNLIEKEIVNNLSLYWPSGTGLDRWSYLISDNYWNGIFSPEHRWPWRSNAPMRYPFSTPVHVRISYLP